MPATLPSLIDDNLAARLQAGLSAVALVYQTPADGGEDRHMFVYRRPSESVTVSRSGPD